LTIIERLRSVKLAVGLLLYLTVGGVLATLIPQGLDQSYYQGHYPKLLAEFILQTRFDRFFTSLLFLFPSLLFILNLAACSVHRFVRELKKVRGPKRFGPDILHFGLILLSVGAVVSFSSRQEGFVELSVGDKIEIPGGFLLSLVDFQYLTYADGRPKDWISTVKVTKGNETVRERFDIRVNHPLSVGSVTLYQVSHGSQLQLVLEERSGKTLTLTQGERITRGDAALFFMAPDDKTGEGANRKAIIHRVTPAGSSVIRAGVGDKVGDLAVKSIQQTDITGIEAVSDPGLLPVFAAFIIITIGLALTFFQKIGDRPK